MIYILLEREFIVIDSNNEIPIYTFKYCFTQQEFNAFLSKEYYHTYLFYDPIQAKLKDKNGFEYFQVITKDIK